MLRKYEKWAVKPSDPFGTIFFFEGLDKTGKTTLTRRCRFEANPAHPAMMVDRGIVGRRVFWHWNDEPQFRIERWNALEQNLRAANAYAVVWLRAGIKACIQRAVAAGEDEPRVDHLLAQEQYYRRYIEVLKREGVPVLEIFTDEAQEDDCVQSILGWMGFGWQRPVHK